MLCFIKLILGNRYGQGVSLCQQTSDNFPLPIPSCWTKHHPCPLYQATTLGGGLPSSIMGARRQNLRLARHSADSVCLPAYRYLHHSPPGSHTWPGTLTTPFHAAKLHSPAPPPCLHPCTKGMVTERPKKKGKI